MEKIYDSRGFDKNGVHRNGTKYNDEGYDYFGYNEQGFNRAGINKNGLTREQQKEQDALEQEKKIKQKKEMENQRRRNFLGLIHKAEKLSKGEMTLDEYLKCSKTSIDDLIEIAKREHMDASVIRGLHRHKKPYNVYKKPFSKKDYLSSTILMIEGKEVRPTEKDVDKCVAYLTAMDAWICDKTVRDTVRAYKKGELDIEESLRKAILDEQIEIKSQETEIANLKSQNKGEI